MAARCSATAVGVVGVLAYLACTLGSGLPDRLQLVLVEAGLTTAPLLAAAYTFRVGLRHRAPALLLFGAAVGSWGVGNAIWNVYGLTLGDLSPFPSWADLFYLLLLPLAGAGLLRLSEESRTLGRLRVVCDSVICGVALFAAAWPIVLRTAVDGNPDLLARLVSCAYPFGDVALLALVVPALSRVHGRWRPVLLRLTLGICALAASDLLFAVLSSTGSWTTVHPFSAGWVIAFAAVASAASVWPAGNGSQEPTAMRPVSPLLQTSAYLPVLVGSAVTLHQLLTGDLDVVGGLALLTVVVLGTLRQHLAFWENDHLTRDLEDRVRARTTELALLAYTDPLTGLANRTRFQDLLDELAAAGTHPTVVLLDLDGFKAVNDTLGHTAGDELLAAVATRLRHACPGAVLLARLGGDEFALVLPNDSVADATSCADRILAELTAPFPLAVSGATEVRIAASIGIAGLPHGDLPHAPQPSATADGAPGDAGDVLQNADLAMYAAKNAGRNRWCAFDPAMRRDAELRKSLEDDLHEAVEREELRLVYQPVVHLPTGRVVGAEALLRWDHPVRGSVPPAVFIPVAEETGLIAPIGAWVLEQACLQAARWKQRLTPDAEFGCGVNLSVRQLGKDLPSTVEHALRVSGLPADALVLEVTESVFMDDGLVYPELLQQLRRLGPKVFLDDFGTGFSSLSYLRRFPVDGLKVDRSFVGPLEDGDDALPAAILRLADSLGLAVVAEGVETPLQRVALQALGCQLAQGFGLHRPMEVEAFDRLLEGIPLPSQRAAAAPGRTVPRR